MLICVFCKRRGESAAEVHHTASRRAALQGWLGMAPELVPCVWQEDTDSDMSDPGNDTASAGGMRRAPHPHGMLRTMYRAALRAAATMSSSQCGP